MQLTVISLGSSVFALALTTYFFYMQHLKRKKQSLFAISKRSDWIEPVIETQKEERLEENIAEEIMSSILPQAKNSQKAAREAKLVYDYDVMALYVLAASNRPFQGYELLQAISGNGFSYGKMRIFHRHEKPMNPETPVLFSLANALEPGFFNLSEVGSFSCTGLILFMRFDNHHADLTQHFRLMLDSAKQLADDLGGEVFDDTRNFFDAASEQRYLARLADAVYT